MMERLERIDNPPALCVHCSQPVITTDLYTSIQVTTVGSKFDGDTLVLQVIGRTCGLCTELENLMAPPGLTEPYDQEEEE